MKDPTVELISTVIGVICIILFLLWGSHHQNDLQGGNEVITQYCTSDNKLEILVGTSTGEKETVKTDIYCKKVGK